LEVEGEERGGEINGRIEEGGREGRNEKMKIGVIGGGVG
jgi:hypothetical protein